MSDSDESGRYAISAAKKRGGKRNIKWHESSDEADELVVTYVDETEESGVSGDESNLIISTIDDGDRRSKGSTNRASRSPIEVSSDDGRSSAIVAPKESRSSAGPRPSKSADRRARSERKRAFWAAKAGAPSRGSDSDS
ncbi:hypothetical protein DL93DRAFT_2071015 [Clavulina sp. PMI_390]|nr:hypothetical protein DL93DRAFT_2071015 [Clavulina sp. PMI_390]